MLLSENILTGGNTMAYNRIVEFKEDGTWEDLASFRGVRPAYDPTPLQRGTGTFDYRVTAPDRAEVVLHVRDGLGSPLGDSRSLQFTDEHSGLIDIAGGVGRFMLTRGPSEAPIVNQSSRAFVTSLQPIHSGFVLREASYVLIRAIGPTLRQFGIPQPSSNPRLMVAADTRTLISNDDWGDELSAVTRISQKVGAFSLVPGSKDAVLVVRLNPGAYVATAAVDGEDSGELLLEIYLFHAFPPL